jgi:hypothetical protein
MKLLSEEYIVQRSSWKEGKSTCNDQGSKIEQHHFSFVCSYIALFDSEVGCGNRPNGEKTEQVNVSKVVQKSGPNVSWHEQSNHRCKQHQDHVDSSPELVNPGSFFDE